MASRIWHRTALGGHLGWGFLGWGDARIVAVYTGPGRLLFEVLGHYVGLYR